mmetsp:Transcript_14401/g.36417  ORF Transcript_14401/g.36417 Transcript_14401/m.36417 type:complete len:276 (-) Transcript_14401:501-1328(-)
MEHHAKLFHIAVRPLHSSQHAQRRRFALRVSAFAHEASTFHISPVRPSRILNSGSSIAAFAVAASSNETNRTNPKHLDPPSLWRITVALSTSNPHPSKKDFRILESADSGSLLTRRVVPAPGISGARESPVAAAVALVPARVGETSEAPGVVGAQATPFHSVDTDETGGSETCWVWPEMRHPATGAVLARSSTPISGTSSENAPIDAKSANTAGGAELDRVKEGSSQKTSPHSLNSSLPDSGQQLPGIGTSVVGSISPPAWTRSYEASSATIDRP